MKYTLNYVSKLPALWSDEDPVRPELDKHFKTAPGRGVFGLKNEEGEWKAFMCYARTNKVPKDVKELDTFTDVHGDIIVPYTVWSHEKGAGREIINEVLWMVRNVDIGINRVVTLSPPTGMAKKFHLRNGAFLLSSNEVTVNFEYEVISSE